MVGQKEFIPLRPRRHRVVQQIADFGIARQRDVNLVRQCRLLWRGILWYFRRFEGDAVIAHSQSRHLYLLSIQESLIQEIETPVRPLRGECPCIATGYSGINKCAAWNGLPVVSCQILTFQQSGVVKKQVLEHDALAFPLVHVQEMVALDYPAPREQIIWCLRRDMAVQPGDVEFAGMDFEKKARIVILAAVRIVAAVPKGCAGAEITPVPVLPIFSDEHL